MRSQSAVAAMLSSPNGLLTTTIVFVLMSIAFTGAIASWLLKIKNYDPIARLSGALDMPVFWRSCTWHHPVPSLNPFTNLSYCDPGIAGGIEAALLGSVVVGVFGLCVGLLQEAMGPHRNLIGLMLGPIGWLGSMGERERVRVIMALGSVLAARYVYLQVKIIA